MTLNRREACAGLAAAATLVTTTGCSTAPSSPTTPTHAAAATPPPPRAPEVAVGRLERWDPFPSRHVPPRPVEVWLPPGYDGRRPHAVLYAHDGQMLFDPRTTWNRQAWGVDRVAAPLIAEGRLRDCIVVGPWNGGPRRSAEFFPAAWWARLDAAGRAQMAPPLAGEPPSGEAWLRFLVEELKPAVDRRYATRPGREDCALMGSSRGAAISLFALCERPDVFGAAACLSTHWIGSFQRNAAVPDAILGWLRETLPPPERVRLWMDRGTRELDALYDEAQARVDALMAERGFRPPRFRSVVHDGSGHNETDWQRVLAQPLLHVLGA